MFGKTHTTLCVVLLLWSSTAQSAAGSYDDVITKLDNLLYRVVMSEVNIKERLEETEVQLKKTLEQLDTLMEHQNGLVQGDDQLLAKMEEQHEKLMQNQESIREEFKAMLADVEEDVTKQLNVLISDVAEDHAAIASRLNEAEQVVSEKFVTAMANIGHHFDRTEEKLGEILQNQETNRLELLLKLSNVQQDMSHNFNTMITGMNEGFVNTDKRFDVLTQQQADLATGHEALASTMAKMEQNVSEQFAMTLANMTDSFDKTNWLIEYLAEDLEKSSAELSSKLTIVQQDINRNFNQMTIDMNEGFEHTDKRFDVLAQNQADLATGHEALASTLAKLENNVSEQFAMTLTNITESFDKTNEQIGDLAKNQENSRVELLSKLTSLKQDMTQNFNVMVSKVNEGFDKANVRFDRLTQKQDDLAASQSSFASTLTKMESNMNDKFVKTMTNINDRSDKLEAQHKTTKDQLDRLLQNLENHRNEFSSTLSRIEQSTNQNLVVLINQSQQILQQQVSCSKPEEPAVVTSCKNTPSKTNGQYQLKPFGTDEVMVGYCEQEKFGGGWLVVQHRFDGSVDFQRTWSEYKNGFGSLGGEFWLGLEKLHRLTSNRNVELIVELKDYNNNYVYARYDGFEIGSEPQKYSLDRLGTYSGTAGDSMIYNRGKKFTTKDSDNDGAVNLNCAVSRAGAWWFNWCGNADLNGIFGVRGEWRSIYWYGYNQYDGMKYTRMLIREV